MMIKKQITATLGIVVMAYALTGCGASTEHVRINLNQSSAPNALAASDMNNVIVPGNVLAAADGLGVHLFGPPEIRDQFAMLRNANEAFARAEAEAADDISGSTDVFAEGENTDQQDVAAAETTDETETDADGQQDVATVDPEQE